VVEKDMLERQVCDETWGFNAPKIERTCSLSPYLRHW